MHSHQSALHWSGRKDLGRSPCGVQPLSYDPLVQLLLNEVDSVEQEIGYTSKQDQEKEVHAVNYL